MSFHSYRIVFCAPIPTGPRTPDFGFCSMSYCTKGIWFYSVFDLILAEIPQFHLRLEGWAGATEPPAHIKSMRT